MCALRHAANSAPQYWGTVMRVWMCLQPGDLADFSSEWVDPISINYRGWKVYELPPNGQGMAALEMLNIMAASQPDKQGPQGTVELHKKIEAMKLAYTDLYRYNGDPRFASIPVRGGRGQAVLHNSATGTNFAASDPRADGYAEPEARPTK